MKNKPYLPDVNAIIQSGIDPKTGLPIKLGSDESVLKSAIKKLMRIMDEQQAVNRYNWINLPSGISGRLLERILYYRGGGMFFQDNKKFYFLPFALEGTIDYYGRYNSVVPLPFNGGVDEDEKKKKPKPLEHLVRHVIYDVVEAFDEANPKTDCVILRDYTEQEGEYNIPRVTLQEPVIEFESEIIPFARTSLIANSGVKGVRVTDQSAASNVIVASESVYFNALTGKPWVPISAMAEFQDLTSPGNGRTEDYLMTLQSVDNFRKSCYGLNNGGLFEKKAHTLNSEQKMNSDNSDLIYNDGLKYRQKFCDLVNAIFGLGIWCESTNQDESNNEDDAFQLQEKKGGETNGNE